MMEEERKYEVDARWAMPDLTDRLPSGGRVHPRPPATLRATYYDTTDLRLARAGVSLRFRRDSGGDALPWTVKLPTSTPGTRHEINRPGGPTTIPTDLVDLVSVHTRGARLVPSATLRTTRVRYDLRDRDGRILAEVADDTVSVLDDRRIRLKFREIEIERRDCTPKLMRRLDTAMRAAGAVGGTFVAKHVRALGERASELPDLAAPIPLPAKPSAADVVTFAVRTDIARVIDHDPLVRLRATIGDSDTAVHRMRVGVRRLRADLRTFASLVSPSWAVPLSTELTWLGDVLGAARDAEVLRARLRRSAASDPRAPLDGPAVARIDADLAVRHEEALTALDTALASARYRALIDTLFDVAADPDLTPPASRSARRLLPPLVARAWHRLALGSSGLGGAGVLAPDASDAVWHATRIRAKRARYAAEAAAPAIGAPAAELALALADLQDVLGEHQDAVVAARTWLAIARSDPDDHLLAVTAGRLFERERAAARTARAEYPAAWRAARAGRLTSWLR